uniref:PARP catalytic domain-containing protein n=1 Tax=Salvator merianae TaxID=96440 RepID=A0A8D0C7D0_SALMN
EKNGPFVELIGHSWETLEEAGLWLGNIIQVEETHQIAIKNYNVLNLGNGQPLELSHLQQHFGITISESLSGEAMVLEIHGSPRAVIDATFAIEFMLQTTAKQEGFCLIPSQGSRSKQYIRLIPTPKSHSQSPALYACNGRPLYCIILFGEQIIFFFLQIEKICNPLLESTFQRIKRKVEGKNTGMPVCHRLYHRVPAQYCSLVCKTGFQKTYSSSQDQKYGAGIYFNKNPRNLVADSKEKCEMDHLICVFEAEVVTGSYTRGNRSYVAPPLINTSSMKLYDSVVDDIHNPETFVVFNREQALPLYLLTCSFTLSSGPSVNFIYSN